MSTDAVPEPRRDQHGTFVVETLEDLGPILTIMYRQIERNSQAIEQLQASFEGHGHNVSEISTFGIGLR